jgi:hypothetical protein
MFRKIEKPAACKIQSVIHFLNARNMNPADIHRQLCEVYGERAMSDSIVRRWVRHLMKDAKMCMMIRVVADHLWLMKIWCVQWKRRFKRTDDSPSRHFPCNIPQILQSLLHKIVSDELRFWKLCSCWVPKMLTDEQKIWQASALTFLT